MVYVNKIKKTGAVQSVIRLIKNYRASKLKYTDFTIISNNCWGGAVSQYFGLKKNSPTVGLYFFAPDYIKFVYNLRYYIAHPLEIIPNEKSRYHDILVARNEGNTIIGRLHDIEIVFLHYHSEEEVLSKWKRRRDRINWDKLFIKFSEMNLCTERELKYFDELPFQNKVLFTRINRPDLKSSRHYPGYENEAEIIYDTKPANKCLNLIAFLNQPNNKYEICTPKELMPNSTKVNR